MSKRREQGNVALRHVNKTPIPGDDLMKYADEVQDLEEGLRGYEGQVAVAARLFGNVDKAFSARTRMSALAKIVSSGTLPGWAQEAKADGSIGVNEALFHAAGQARMKIDGNEIVFVRNSLLRKAFQMAKNLRSEQEES